MSKKNWPDIKRERLPGTIEEDVELQDSKGKKHKGKEVTYREQEIEAKNLVKLAPMYYYCPDNNKVFFIPISIEFSPTQSLELFAKVAHNLDAEMKKFIAKEDEIKAKAAVEKSQEGKN